MEDGIFDCPAGWEPWLPPGTLRPREAGELAERDWGILALTSAAGGSLGKVPVRCRCLLAAGECGPAWPACVEAESVITYGLSPRDSLTLSSLQSPVLCVQRSLLRPDGAVIEPQEIPLPVLPYPAEELLPLFGLRLLQMPLTTAVNLW